MLNYTEPFSRFTSVGPAVASEMKSKAVLALIYSMLAIFVYIWLRFQFRAAFGIGACVALVHDVLFTLGAISVADEFFGIGIQVDLTIVAALLTIVGYSLNDTIVVFDRIRENLKSGASSLTETINISLNQTLSRTLLTSLTTLLVVLALLVWGGEVIRGFAFSLLIGVGIGTFSSIFIAAPILVYMAEYKSKRNKGEAKA
jgi:preprotein translocase subunit SecF